jgi:hypothetical protein
VRERVEGHAEDGEWEGGGKDGWERRRWRTKFVRRRTGSFRWGR